MYSSAQAEALMRLGQEALQEDLKRKERAENNELRKACLTELLKEDPKVRKKSFTSRLICSSSLTSIIEYLVPR